MSLGVYEVISAQLLGIRGELCTAGIDGTCQDIGWEVVGHLALWSDAAEGVTRASRIMDSESLIPLVQGWYLFSVPFEISFLYSLLDCSLF